MQYLKQYGLQASGTNYCKYVLEQNFHCHVHVNVGGHKHCPAKARPDFISVRDPYDWLASCYKNKVYGIAGPDPQYRAGEWTKQEFLEYLPVLLDHYQTMNLHWLSFNPVVIFYNEASSDPHKHFMKAAIDLRLEPVRRDFIIPERRMGKGFERAGEIDQPFNRRYSIDRCYLEMFTDLERDMIKDRLDPSLRRFIWAGK